MAIANLSNLINELKQKDFYKKFIEENPDAFLAAGFFVLDLDSENHKYQLDFFLPKLNKLAISEYPFNEIKIQNDEIKEAKILDENLKIDTNNLVDEINNLKIKNDYNKKTSKIVAILKDDLWNLTCLSPSLDVLRIHLNSLNGNCEKFEKINMASFMDVRKGKKEP